MEEVLQGTAFKRLAQVRKFRLNQANDPVVGKEEKMLVMAPLPDLLLRGYQIRIGVTEREQDKNSLERKR